MKGVQSLANPLPTEHGRGLQEVRDIAEANGRILAIGSTSSWDLPSMPVGPGVIAPDLPPSPTPVSLLYPHSRQLSLRVRVFIDWLAREVAQRLPPRLQAS